MEQDPEGGCVSQMVGSNLVVASQFALRKRSSLAGSAFGFCCAKGFGVFAPTRKGGGGTRRAGAGAEGILVLDGHDFFPCQVRL